MSESPFFVYVSAGAPGLKRNLVRVKVSCSRTQCSDVAVAQSKEGGKV